MGACDPDLTPTSGDLLLDGSREDYVCPLPPKEVLPEPSKRMKVQISAELVLLCGYLRAFFLEGTDSHRLEVEINAFFQSFVVGLGYLFVVCDLGFYFFQFRVIVCHAFDIIDRISRRASLSRRRASLSG